ncbi:substrate-binding domain-containing protein [Kitasatospora purpeofusca]|uniref:LacI family DNA-binding transcriptional regulator n=1 Tax=Kitasatospora purpeofusca TaxID=67352 RepID=UPI0030F1DCA7
MSSAGEERRARVLAVVEELGTVRLADLAERLGMPLVTLRRDVSALAEAGRLHRTHGSVSALSAMETPTGPSVGLVVPTVSQYFDEVIAGARAAAQDAGVHLTLGIASYLPGTDRVQVERLLASGVKGLLLTPNWMPSDHIEDRAWINDLPVPVVLVEREPPTGSPAARLDSVCSNHHYGVLLALDHLASLGHRRIALAARVDTWTALKVHSGYAEGCRSLGLPEEPTIDIDPAAGMESVAERIGQQVRAGVEAVVVHNDQDAIQLLPLLRAAGVSVPEDLAMVSYDDVFAALGAPPLTAVAPPKHAVGAAAVELIVRRLAKRSGLPVHHLDLLPDLKIRRSCGADR